jgi:uncharacterized peroxidase-related enzyme
MPFFPSLPDCAGIGELWSLNPSIRKPMNDLGKAIMRDESPLTPGQRETIAAFVSGINKCDYCFKGHIEMAVNLGADRTQILQAIDNIETSTIDPTFKAILAYVNILTLSPATISQADADAVYAAGWSERALHDAILVCCRFNFMNRLSLGHGLDPDGVDPKARAQKMSYAQPT